MVQLLSSTATWAIIIVNIVNHWGEVLHSAGSDELWLSFLLRRSLGQACSSATQHAYSEPLLAAGYFIYLNWIPSYFYKVISDPRNLAAENEILPVLGSDMLTATIMI